MASPVEIENLLNETPDWLQPGNALARVEAALGDRAVAIDTLIGRLKAGLLRAMAERHGWENITNPPRITDAVIEPRYWSHYERGDQSSYVWKTGDLRLWVGGTYSHTMTQTDGRLTFFRVKIERQGIDEIVANAPTPEPKRSVWIKPKPPEPKPEPPPQKNQGGRPRKDYWDELWAEICVQIYEGKLIPDRQAAIEKAMLDWATNHGHDLAEPTARIRAKILFNRLQKRG